VNKKTISFGLNANKNVGTKALEQIIETRNKHGEFDSLFDFNLKNMIRQHKKKKSFITMSLYEYKTNIKYGVIDTKNNGYVSAWNEKPEIKAKVNIGCYVMEPATLGFIPKNRSFGMDSVIKKAISKRKAVNSFLSKKGFTDIGDKETYEKINLQYKKKTGKI